MVNFILILILAIIIGSVSVYLYKARKRGEGCIGCPYSKQCAGKCGQ